MNYKTKDRLIGWGLLGLMGITDFVLAAIPIVVWMNYGFEAGVIVGLGVIAYQVGNVATQITTSGSW